MTASLWLAAALACAQVGPTVEPVAANPTQDVSRQAENVPPPRPAASKITDVTVYQGQALVTREVSVPEGDGTVELVVTPLPAQTVDSSLYTEGTDGLRVLSTRFRTRAVKEDTRQEVRVEAGAAQETSGRRQSGFKKRSPCKQEDLGYLQKLGGFTSTALTGLTEKGRLDSEAIVSLSKFVMDNRGTKTKIETDLRQQLQANTEATEFATRQLAELSAGTSRVERDAVIVVHKARPQAGTVRLGYLVGSAKWRPQYRLRGGVGRRTRPARVPRRRGPANRRVVAGRPRHAFHRPAFARCRAARAAAAQDGRCGRHRLRPDRCAMTTSRRGSSRSSAKPISMSFPRRHPARGRSQVRQAGHQVPGIPRRHPDLRRSHRSPGGREIDDVDREKHGPGGNTAQGHLETAIESAWSDLQGQGRPVDDHLKRVGGPGELDDEEPRRAGGMMGGMGFSLEQAQASGGAMLNQEAATDQAEELRVADRQSCHFLGR